MELALYAAVILQFSFRFVIAHIHFTSFIHLNILHIDCVVCSKNPIRLKSYFILISNDVVHKFYIPLQFNVSYDYRNIRHPDKDVSANSQVCKMQNFPNVTYFRNRDVNASVDNSF